MPNIFATQFDDDDRCEMCDARITDGLCWACGHRQFEKVLQEAESKQNPKETIH